MKTLVLVLSLVWLADLRGHEAEKAFEAALREIQNEYRRDLAELIRSADRIDVYLMKFDGLVADSGSPFEDPSTSLPIAPYEKRARILRSRTLKPGERDPLRKLLAQQIGKRDHSGGTLCHYPIHGVRVYQGEELLHEGTFCWLCGNASFAYPTGPDWLDTSPELEQLFLKLMPIPEEELKRFEEKYPKK